MKPQALKEYKAGQRQGNHDYYNGPHKRFTRAINSNFAAGYVQGYSVGEAEEKHRQKNEEF